jgi:hypothetical protein
MRQKSARRITRAVMYVSLFVQFPLPSTLFYAIMLMLHQCGERVTSLKHAIVHQGHSCPLCWIK